MKNPTSPDYIETKRKITEAVSSISRVFELLHGHAGCKTASIFIVKAKQVPIQTAVKETGNFGRFEKEDSLESCYTFSGRFVTKSVLPFGIQPEFRMHVARCVFMLVQYVVHTSCYFIMTSSRHHLLRCNTFCRFFRPTKMMTTFWKLKSFLWGEA